MSAPMASAWKVIPTFKSQSIERTIHFYVDILGFNLASVKPEDEPPAQYTFCSIFAGDKAAANLYFFKPSGDTLTPSSAYIALGTTQLDLLYESLKVRNDVEIVEEIQDQPWGYRQFAINDPDGNTLTFFKFLEGGNPGEEWGIVKAVSPRRNHPASTSRCDAWSTVYTPNSEAKTNPHRIDINRSDSSPNLELTMSVTECAICPLEEGYDEDKFLNLLKEAQHEQNRWIRKHQPHLLEGRPYENLSSFSIQKSSPPLLLITAPWDSPEGHAEWIASDENKVVMGQLSSYFAENSHMVFYHLDHAGGEDDLRGDIFAQGPFNLWRLTVKPDHKDKLQELFRNVESHGSTTEPSKRIWGGWRIGDKKLADEQNGGSEERGTEQDPEVVVFWTRDVKYDVGGRLSQVHDPMVFRYEWQPLL
ncbi:hypothetical protein FZEAL_5822 [Fusarium zealandicum]|uniref:VOC domain-containing protein n=1 Tax=Fusarium zealandicum TaxID=1053134 RepID=A0A8H4UJ44_9HYPO|nr:hypothetical protein FZEAL_5822 [Fusarium zealandicum]